MQTGLHYPIEQHMSTAMVTEKPIATLGGPQLGGTRCLHQLADWHCQQDPLIKEQLGPHFKLTDVPL